LNLVTKSQPSIRLFGFSCFWYGVTPPEKRKKKPSLRERGVFLFFFPVSEGPNGNPENEEFSFFPVFGFA
jgi:hypothetical protein